MKFDFMALPIANFTLLLANKVSDHLVIICF